MKNFSDEIQNINLQLEQLKAKSNFYHIASLLSFIGIFVFIVVANYYYPLLAIGSLVSLVLFIVVVMRRETHENLNKTLKNKILVLKQYNYRINNQYQTFNNTGVKYLEEDKFYLSDLDIFGDSSLFQLINVCETKMGQNNLAQRLKCNDDRYLKDSLLVNELKNKIDFSIQFQSNIYGYSKDLTKTSLELSVEELKITPKKNILIDIILPILLLVATLLSVIISIYNTNISYFLAVLVINISVTFLYSIIRKINFISIKEIVKSLSPLSSNFELITNTTFENNELINIKNNIIYGNDAMKKLNKIETLVNLQDNFVSSFVLNAIFPFNMFVFLCYDNFHKKTNTKIEDAIKDYTNLEALLSLAIIPQIKTQTCVPNKIDNLNINFKNIKHPLIKEELCVSNDLSIKPSVNIITGSNMSGKTSFLRTIGINLVLMYAGGLVNAKEFNSDVINIYSSMRITDDIKNGISTFYRELLRIKNAIKDANSNIKSIIFIDEVFRGTNSNDRILGAISLINHLKLPNVILFMTTHDFELCKVEGVNNYHFEEHYKDDKIMFDYKLKDGKCNTTNAVYLMKLAGIISKDA